MNLLLIIISVFLAFAAGYALATLRTQREAVRAKVLLEAERKHSNEGMRKIGRAHV